MRTFAFIAFDQALTHPIRMPKYLPQAPDLGVLLVSATVHAGMAPARCTVYITSVFSVYVYFHVAYFSRTELSLCTT